VSICDLVSSVAMGVTSGLGFAGGCVATGAVVARQLTQVRAASLPPGCGRGASIGADDTGGGRVGWRSISAPVASMVRALGRHGQRGPCAVSGRAVGFQREASLLGRVAGGVVALAAWLWLDGRSRK
jgi:hypothetical protein